MTPEMLEAFRAYRHRQLEILAEGLKSATNLAVMQSRTILRQAQRGLKPEDVISTEEMARLEKVLIHGGATKSQADDGRAGSPGTAGPVATGSSS